MRVYFARLSCNRHWYRCLQLLQLLHHILVCWVNFCCFLKISFCVVYLVGLQVGIGSPHQSSYGNFVEILFRWCVRGFFLSKLYNFAFQVVDNVEDPNWCCNYAVELLEFEITHALVLQDWQIFLMVLIHRLQKFQAFGVDFQCFIWIIVFCQLYRSLLFQQIKFNTALFILQQSQSLLYIFVVRFYVYCAKQGGLSLFQVITLF